MQNIKSLPCLGAKALAEQLRDVLLVIDDQDAHTHGALPGAHEPDGGRATVLSGSDKLLPTWGSMAPCSPPSRPLRAGGAGGLRPVLTAAVRGAGCSIAGRDGETVSVEQRNRAQGLTVTASR